MTITPQLSVHDWLALPMPVRQRLAEVFSIPRSTGTLVEGNTVKSDGHTYTDLQAITVGKMQEYLGSGYSSDTTFEEYLNLTITKAEDEVKPTEAAVKTPTKEELLLLEWGAVLNRLRGQAVEHGLDIQLIDLVKQTFNRPLTPVQNGNQNAEKATDTAPTEAK